VTNSDFWLYSWQFSHGEWIDSHTGSVRKLPPIEEHRRDLCQCPLCRPERHGPGQRPRSSKKQIQG
jgi:hypothetical protein